MVYGDGLLLCEIGKSSRPGVISTGSFTLIFTILAMLTMTDAYNLIDSADGLAGSLVLIVLLAIAAVPVKGPLNVPHFEGAECHQSHGKSTA